MFASNRGLKVAIPFVLAVLAPSLCQAGEQWTYAAYTPSGMLMATNHVELTEEDGKAFVTIFNYHEYADKCYTRKMKATVTRDADFTVVTTEDMMRGCAPIRLLIKKDGTGGRQEVQTNGEWVWDKLDHGLIRK
jgi:hypothetical protein